MNLQAPTMEQSGLISIVVGVARMVLVYTQVQVKRINNVNSKRHTTSVKIYKVKLVRL